MFKPAFPSAASPSSPVAAPLSVWARWAVWLSFVAVLSLLVAPASLLAQDLQTGKLGGVCTTLKVSAAEIGAVDAADAADPALAHCPLCSVSWGLPTSPLALPLPPTVGQAAAVAATADPAARVTGLPFSRAPPAA